MFGMEVDWHASPGGRAPAASGSFYCFEVAYVIPKLLRVLYVKRGCTVICFNIVPLLSQKKIALNFLISFQISTQDPETFCLTASFNLLRLNSVKNTIVGASILFFMKLKIAYEQTSYEALKQPILQAVATKIVCKHSWS
jgi:hypothetical protein